MMRLLRVLLKRLRKVLTKRNVTRGAVWLALAGAIGLVAFWAIWANDAPSWTGFGEYTNAQGELVREKTLWDWLDLLIVPAVLALAAYLLNRSQRRAEMKVAAEQRRHDMLQDYLDRMSELLLNSGLGDVSVSAGPVGEIYWDTGGNGESAASLGRARTLTVLRTLDSDRVAAVFRFLKETRAGGRSLDEIITMERADLREVDWSGAYLMNVNLRRAWLMEANLQGAFLRESSLEGASLQQANLGGASLFKANLAGALMWRANLKGAYLREAKLLATDLKGTDLRKADLAGADLRKADLRDARVTTEQLLAADSLEGATMPDGRKYDVWIGRHGPPSDRGADGAAGPPATAEEAEAAAEAETEARGQPEG